MTIKTYAPFGYEGAICSVEVDLRQGIPSVDIVGFADAGVKELRERVKAAINNAGFTFPQKRVLISLSPADLRKEGGGFDLPVALAILREAREVPVSKDTDVFVMGELELSGKVRATAKVFAALQTAVSNGIKYAIVPKDLGVVPDGIRCARVDNLEDAFRAICNLDECGECIALDETLFTPTEANRFETDNDHQITFQPVNAVNSFDSKYVDPGLVTAMAIAMAGRHHVLAYGPPGCGKSLVMNLSQQLMPNLSAEEQVSVNRIWSLAYLTKPDKKIIQRPFRMPHQTASIEGICGGGPHCRPGEISLAHNGVLFLDEAAEFRSSVLQMLRVPLESGSITISRAGRATTYPANFQLLMATNPCPCGNYGSHDKICLCSLKTVEQYWKKFSEPLLDRIAIRYNCNEPIGAQRKTVDELRTMIKRAVTKQLQRQGKYNQDLTPEEVDKHILMSIDAREALDKAVIREGYSLREVLSIRKVAQTICDMVEANYANLTAYSINQAVRLLGKKFPWG